MDALFQWSGPPIRVIGMGIGMAPPKEQLEKCDIIIGASRHLEYLSPSSALKLTLPSPLSSLGELLHEHQLNNIAILASGDPLLFGIGDWLIRYVGRSNVIFYPAISSIQAAFAKTGIAWQDAVLISLHGRPLASLRSQLYANRIYAILTDQSSQPHHIAQELCEAGYSESTLWVAEALGTSEETLHRYSAIELINSSHSWHPLQVVVVNTKGYGAITPEFPGIPDHNFMTDDNISQQFTKREVRLSALSLLQPRAKETGWDVGAGCGALAVEWACWNRLGHVYAVEQKETRLAVLRQNQQKFGVIKNLSPLLGTAPDALKTLPDPHAIFIGGGGDSLEEILQTCWQRLLPRGRLVVSTVTENTRAALTGFAKDKSSEWLELAISKGDHLGRQRMLRPQLPVLLVKFDKEKQIK